MSAMLNHWWHRTVSGDALATAPSDNLEYAYSVTNLVASGFVGSIVRYRRDSDQAESDFGTVGGALDIASILSWVGANNAFLTTVYDQSGNTRDASQAAAASQPTTVTAGAMETMPNGKPCAVSVDKDLDSSSAVTIVKPILVMGVVNMTNHAHARAFWDGNSGSGTATITQLNPSPGIGQYQGSFVNTNSGLALATDGIVAANFDQTNSFVRINDGASVGGSSPGTHDMKGTTIGAWQYASGGSHFKWQTWLVYGADQETAARDYLNGLYSIF